jgi:hypothetical protein
MCAVVWASIIHPKLDVTEVMQVVVPGHGLPVLMSTLRAELQNKLQRREGMTAG